MMSVLTYVNDDQAPLLERIMRAQLDSRHFGALNAVAQDSAFDGHPVRAGIGRALASIEPPTAYVGALSISAGPDQAGALSSVAQQGGQLSTHREGES